MSLSQLILWTKKTLALRKKMKVSIKDVFSKCDQIRTGEILNGNFIFVECGLHLMC